MELADSRGTSARLSEKNYRSDQRFFLIYSIIVSVVVFVGFAQLSLRGGTDIITAPIRVQIHGGLMTIWLGAFVVQNWLAEKGSIALHRKLGKATILLVAAIAANGLYTIYMTVVDQRPMAVGLGNSLFLALAELSLLAFVGTVVWAIGMRRDTQWHRRLMIGAAIFLLDGALGRVLPADWPVTAFDTTITLVQLLALGLLAVHDVRILGHVHRATIWLAVLVVLFRVGYNSLAAVPSFSDYAGGLAG